MTTSFPATKNHHRFNCIPPMPLPDITGAMKSFQAALDEGRLQMRPGALDRSLLMHMDRPNGETRLTYARLEGNKVTVFIEFMQAEAVEGEPCFSVGWAVPKEFQGSGKAGEAFIAALKELRHGFAPHGMVAFWVEGIVGTDNIASRRVAEKVISAPVRNGLDGHAGVPIIQYLRRVDAQTCL